MKLAISCLTIAAVLTPYAGAEDHRREFDVHSGHFSQLLGEPVEPGVELYCHVKYDDLRSDDFYAPSFSIAFSAIDGPIEKENPQPEVRISLMIADDKGKVFRLSVIDSDGPRSDSAFLGLAEGDSEAALKLTWIDGGLFTYQGRSSEEFGQGYVFLPDIVPKFATVFASGMKGSASCKSAVLTDRK